MADGSASLTGDWATYPMGTISFKGNDVCFTWSGNGEICGGVFRNPGGTKAMENEYIWLIDQGAMTFSQAK